MNLFETGKFVLSSGTKSWWKIDCDALSDSDWATLADLVRCVVPKFSEVHGVPRGGLKLEKLLKPYCCDSGPILIVDDVLTTGGSMESLRDKLDPLGKQEIVGVVVFARSVCPEWIKPLFQFLPG
jgi:orotate phosphoribosyltransferase